MIREDGRDVIPIQPDWPKIVGELYRSFGTYHAMLNALAEEGHVPADHSGLCNLRSGKRKRVSWELGAALMNLHGQLKP